MKSFDESYESFGGFSLDNLRFLKTKSLKGTKAFRTSDKSSQEEMAGSKPKVESTKIYSLTADSFAELCRLRKSSQINPLLEDIISVTSDSHDPKPADVSAIYKFCAFDPFKKNRTKESRKNKGKPVPHYAGINYGSISEAALGILLEELIPGFTVSEGKTYQLPLGGGRTADFLVGNTLVEFHYPRFFQRSNDIGDFSSVKERRDFHKALKRVGRNKHQKKKLLEITHEQLIRNYTNKRRKQIDISMYGPHTELIVAASAQDFYWKVICRFAGVGVISESRFIDRFNECCKSVIRSSRQAWSKAA